jgi:transposase
MRNLLYVGMDVHKETITIACASEGEDIRVAGTIANTAAALDAMVRKLVSGGKRPMFVYEAGPGGYLDAIRQGESRVVRLEGMLQSSALQWKRLEEVKRLQSLRGISFITAVGLLAELGDLRRFKNARQLMAYVGLVPSEHSSGNSVRRGRITKTGNASVRWMLIESAWSYRLKARKGKKLLQRQVEVDAVTAELSWKAQVRLCGRYQRLLQKGKAKGKVIATIARELAGFIWALGTMKPTAQAA